MNNRAKWITVAAAVLLMIACFLPWVHFQSINETFTGFYVKRFANGTYYGRAGYFICTLATLSILFTLLPLNWTKRANIFLNGILFAYCIRTFIVFGSSMFDGDVQRLFGLYLLLILGGALFFSSLFVRIQHKEEE